MAISNYSDLQAAIADWMARSDISGSAADFISLAEARLNRTLGPVATTATLTGVIGSAQIDISSLSMETPENLFITDGVERILLPRPLGTFLTEQEQNSPNIWAIEGNYIKFECPLDQAYSFRFVYQGRFALSDTTTNELLTDYPDVYLSAAIVWGCVYTKSMKDGAMWQGMLDSGIAEVKSAYAQRKRGLLTVDPMLARRALYNSNVDTSL